MSGETTNAKVAELRGQMVMLMVNVATLTVAMNALSLREQSRPRLSSTSRNERSNSGVCWYYRKITEQATKGTSPCTFLGRSIN